MARNNMPWQDNDNHFSGSDRYTNSDRYAQADERMRRGDDRTITGDTYGMNQRNSYRSDDYPTDSDRYRVGGSHPHQGDRSMAYGHYGNADGNGNRNQQNHGMQNFTQNSGSAQTFGPSDRSGVGESSGSYGWSNDYGTSQDYRSQRGPERQTNHPGQSFYGNQTRGQSTDWGQTWGPHSGKGPKGYRRSDDRIRDDVSDVLERHPAIDASEIEVDVKEGIVTLRGHVEERRVKRMAEEAIEHLQGVRDVRNELHIDQTLFQQAKSMLFGDTAESEAANPNANRSLAGKSKH